MDTLKKYCEGCFEILPAAAFARNPSGAHGLRSRCRECIAFEDKYFHPEYAKARARWQRANPERMANYRHRRRGRVAAVPTEAGITREALRARDGDLCYLCGVECDFEPREPGEYRPRAAEIEHRTPLARGGSHTLDNCAIACAACNRAKHDKTDAEFLASRA